jgi:hypothetical protein
MRFHEASGSLYPLLLIAAALKASSMASSSPSMALSVETVMTVTKEDSSSSGKLGERSAMPPMLDVF